MSELQVDQQVDQGKTFAEVIELELDQNGSPVTFESGRWFVLIVPGLEKQ